MRGKINPHPLSFPDSAHAAPKEAALPPRLELTLAIAQIGSAYTIGVPMKNNSESPVPKVSVSLLAKAEDEATAQRIPFAPTSDEALAPGQHREFVFPFEALPALYRLVATQPTDRYGVVIEMDDQRLVFPGEAVKAALTHIEHLSRASEASSGSATGLPKMPDGTSEATPFAGLRRRFVEAQDRFPREIGFAIVMIPHAERQAGAKPLAGSMTYPERRRRSSGGGASRLLAAVIGQRRSPYLPLNDMM
jgi:hypothetical protein